jgi:hypothetical protein
MIQLVVVKPVLEDAVAAAVEFQQLVVAGEILSEEIQVVVIAAAVNVDDAYRG